MDTVDTVSELTQITGKSVSRWLIHALGLMLCLCACECVCVFVCVSQAETIAV